ncbi:MAG: GntR family transcriptional regulator [Lachnospiraceae bacterium]|nr:GntR family transcriptional regulator [Lachnospiraceae bacterium]
MKDMLQENMDEYLPLWDVVFKTLRQGILTGELEPGERLMEIHLAKRLGVSRTPIREAIRKLELEGLVTMVPRKGARVAQITQKGLKDVLEVRRALDALSVQLACERITEEELARLKQAAAEFESATQTKDVTKIAHADVLFHDCIVKATGNERLAQLVSNLSEKLYRYRLEYVKDPDSLAKLIREHEMILEGLTKRDREKAVEAATLHINNQEKAIMRLHNFE